MQKIDLHRILRERIPGGKGKWIPGFMISALERLVHQKELNEVLETTDPSTGSEFADRTYTFFDLGLEVEGLENIPDHRRLIFASNHPLGGLDGIGLIKVLGRRYGDDRIKFLVNDMLMNVEPLRPVFLPINKYGSQGRKAAAEIAQAYRSDAQIVIFPAGLVSRLGDNGDIADLEWHKSFVAKAVESRRDIVPVRFIGLNRPRFYKLAYWRRRLGLKVNIEQAMLPAELCAARGKSFKIKFGKPVCWRDILDSGRAYSDVAADIRRTVHEL